MSVTAHAIPLGVTRCYLLVGRDGRAILVDGGAPGGERAFRQGLARVKIEPEQIGLLLLTHGHWDHFGTAATIREITGAKVAIHHAEAQRVEGALKMMPAATTLWGRLFGTIIAGLMRVAKLPPCPVDLQVGDDGLDLSPFGIAGRAIHTPGHSPGSLTVLVDGGDAYVGGAAVGVRVGLAVTVRHETLGVQDTIRRGAAVGIRGDHAATARQGAATMFSAIRRSTAVGLRAGYAAVARQGAHALGGATEGGAAIGLCADDAVPARKDAPALLLTVVRGAAAFL